MVEKAKYELSLLRGSSEEPDEMQDLIEKDILEIIEIFAKQGHSGFSASYAIPIINKLLKQEPITPLTGENHEWNDVGDGIFQNKRLSSVFKDGKNFDGNPYWINGKVFSDDDGKNWYTNSDSRVEIEFPFTLRKPEYIFVDKAEEDGNI